MRKLFSILAVALLALSAHATVVTKNWDFSGMSAWDAGTATFSEGVVTANAYRGVEKWGWLEREDCDKLIVEVAAHENPIEVKINVLNSGEGDEDMVEIKKEISPSQTCVSFDLTKDIIKRIELNNYSATDGASFTINAIYACKTVGMEKIISVWNDGPRALGNWDHSFYVAPIPTAYAGDELVISYTKEDEAQLQLKEHQTDNFLSFVGDYANINGETETSILLSKADASKVRTSGLFINGKNMTITSIQLRSHSTLSDEETVIGNWSGNIEIPASKLSDLKIGNIICMRVTTIGSTDGPRVSLFSGWSNSDALVGGEYYFQNTDEASAENPFIVQFPVTGSMKQQLGNKNLLIRGVNYTVTDVYVLEGTPVVESGVKGYLTVSTAGMATFMLPFDVPDLPTGVKAYNLTNNGDATIWAEEVTSLTADKPVLIIADAGEYEFVSEEGASADISSKTGTYTNGALVGTYTTIDPLAQTTGGNYNYILQNGSDGVGFYQVRDASCSVAPYRAYLSCGYNHKTTSSSAPKMRIVFRENTTTGVESILPSEVSNQKVLRNGQLFILRNGVEYNANGQMTK